SYEEIAGLTGVPASTIDGRIRRAKAQLRRLLAPEKTGWIGVALSTHPHIDETNLPRPRRKSMAPIQPQEDMSAQAHALTIFTNRLATFVEAGVPAARALNVLRDVPSPYGDASGELYTFLQEAGAEGSGPIFSSERMFVDWLYNPDRYPTLVEHLTRAIEQQQSLLPSRVRVWQRRSCSKPACSRPSTPMSCITVTMQGCWTQRYGIWLR
ncbi:MAG: hypothetical protein JWL77_526, partial [Chthonomonadaceae bacterium]|nr:hypothetical protein [Chthonomonadaceae bacterium]